MRLMSIDVKEYPLQRGEAAASEYVGTELAFSSVGNVRGQLSPASDHFSVELYGDKAATMFTLICETTEDIRKNDRVTLADGDYTVSSVLWFGTHKTAMLERAGIYSGNR